MKQIILIITILFLLNSVFYLGNHFYLVVNFYRNITKENNGLDYEEEKYFIFNPVLITNYDNKNGISKLFDSEKDMNNELEISNLIKEYGNKNKINVDDYFCTIYEKIVLNYKELKKTKRIDLKRINKKTNKFFLLNMPDGGETLDKIETEYDLKKNFINLLLGLKILKDNKILHNDIYEANIVYNGNKSRIIDFGDSINLNMVKNRRKILKNLDIDFRQDYPEFVFLEYIYNLENTPNQIDIHSFFNKNINLNSQDNKYKKEILDLLNYFNSIIKENKLSEFENNFFEELIFHIDLYNLAENMEYLSTEKNVKIDELSMDIIKNIKQLDFRKRYTVEDCLEKLGV